MMHDEQAAVLTKKMIAWFFANYEDPANSVPYDSGEGGYLFMDGGPYDAREELTEEFSAEPGFSADKLEEIIDAAVAKIEGGEGDCYEWARR